jgi:hypothetical protein
LVLITTDQDDEIKEDEMEGSCSTFERVCLEILKETYRVGDLCTAGRIVLK